MQARNILKEEGSGTVADESYVRAATGKWAPFMEGMPDKTPSQRYTRGVTAILFENQAKYLRKLDEETRTVNAGAFTKFVFPVLRRVVPNLISNELVSVQPMTAPVGAVFFQDWIYSSTKGPTTAGNVFPRDFDRDYSSEFINGEILGTGDGSKYAGVGVFLIANLAWKPVRPLNSATGTSVVIKDVTSTGVVVQTATDNGSGVFVGADVAAGGSINYSNGQITGFKFVAAPAASNKVICEYSFDGELNSQQPEMQLDIKRATIEAKSRRVKGLWSSEAAEDLRALHGVDAESELVSAISQELALGIDREVLQRLFLLSTASTGTFSKVPPAGVAEIDHLRSMVTSIATVSNQIHKKTLRAPANWIVTSPDISALLTQLTTHGDFRPLWSPAQGAGSETPYGPIDMIQPGGMPHGQFGIYRMGVLLNKWVVYEDPFFTRDFMMLGLKGASYLDAGFAFCPYVPIQLTPTFLDPSDFGFRKGLRTRYALKALRQEFYGQVRITGL